MARIASERAAFIIQMVVVFLAITTMAGTRPTATYRALGLGGTEFDVGLVQSAYSVLPALFAVPIGRWVDRFGEVVLYSASLAVLALGAVVSGAADSLLVLGAGQALIGLGTVGMLVAGQAMIANRSHPESWNRNYGTYSAFLSLGQLVGPIAATQILALPQAGPEPERAVFVLAGLVSVVAAGLILVVPRTSPGGGGDRTPAGSFRTVIWRILRRRGMLAAMFVSIVVLSAIDVILAYLPVFGEVKGLSVQLVGLLLAVRATTTLLSRLWMDRLLRRLGWVPLLAGSLALAAGSLVLLPLTLSEPVLIVVIGLFGLGLGFGQPMAVSFVANLATKADRATAMAVRLSANRFSLLFVPALMGMVAGSAGIDAVFWVLAGILAAGSAVAATAPMEAARAAEGPAAGQAKPGEASPPAEPTPARGG